MAYTIYNTDGTILLTLADNAVDNVATSLYLIGKNVNNYGQYFNNNMVKLLTSFASSAENQPQAAKTGQLWFDTDEERLKVYNGNEFVPTYERVEKGTRLFQICRHDFLPWVSIKIVDELPESDNRGTGGFGSTNLNVELHARM